MVCCPACGSDRLYKDGLRYYNNGDSVQRWLCRACGYRFSQPNVKLNVRGKIRKAFNPTSNLLNGTVINGDFAFKETLNDLPFTVSEDVGSHKVTVLGKQLNTFPSYNSKRQGSDEPKRQAYITQKGERNLVATEKQTVAGEKQQQDLKSKIINYLLYLQRNNYAKSTVKLYSQALTRLQKANADLMNPESVKEALSNMKVSECRKHIIAAAYTLFLSLNGLSWEAPRENITRKLPFIPTEREIDDLIAGCGKKTAAYLQMIKETAMRMGEAARIKWEDIDLERKIIVLNDPEKNGNPRIFNISNKLVNMLAAIPKKNGFVWGTESKITRGSVFYRERRRIAHKLANPRLLRIGLHTLRHWKATMLYHETKNPVLVKEFLGHKTLDTTLLYIQTEKALFKEENDSFEVQAVKDSEDIKALLEVGFEYICQKDGLMFFRKRK